MASSKVFDSTTALKICQAFSIPKLTDNQHRAITAIGEGSDVFVGTKMGSGKSLTYECMPILFPEKCVVVVIAPLLLIMEEQCKRLSSLGFKATYIGRDEADNDALENGLFQFVFASPEFLVSDVRWRAILNSKLYQEKLKLLVVDEAHTIIQWGESKTDEGPFREWFASVGDLRSLCLDVPLVALTATSNPVQRRAIMRKLCFKKTAVVVVDSPDHENIKICTKQIKNNSLLADTFGWLIDMLSQQGKKCERYVIFCATISDCSKVYQAFVGKFGIGNDQFQMYHSQTNERVKERTRSDMSEDEGDVRVLICTNAAGMGVNFKNVQNIVHYGLPRELDTFVQHMGRAGRDGQFSNELVIYKCHKGHFKRVEAELVKLVREDICRHKQLCDFYLKEVKQIVPLHNCCDVCDIKCECNVEECPVLHPCLQYTAEESNPSEITREVTEKDKQLLKQKLTALKCALEVSGSGQLISSELTHGLTVSVIDAIVNKCDILFTPGDVMKNVACWSYEMASEIMNTVKTVFEEQDMYELEETDDSESDDQ